MAEWLNSLRDAGTVIGFSMAPPAREFDVTLPRGLYLYERVVGTVIAVDLELLPSGEVIPMVPCRVKAMVLENRQMTLTVRVPDDWPTHLQAAVKLWRPADE